MGSVQMWNPVASVPKWLLHGLLIFGLLAVFSYRVHQQLSSGPPSGDAKAYMTMAYNLVNHGVLSLSLGDDEVVPTAYRAPGYPVFAAAVLMLTGEARGVTAEEFLQKRLPGLKMVQALLILLMGLISAYLVWRMTRSVLWPYLAFAGVAGTHEFHGLSARLLSEPLAAFLALTLAFILLRVTEAREPWLFIVAGLAAAVLALTRSAFFYFWPFVLFLFAYLLVQSRWNRRIAAGTMLFLVTFFVVTGSWIARSNHHFGTPVFTERGGLALVHRTEYDKMTNQEFLASFCYWSQCAPLKALLSAFEPEDYARLNWRNEDGYYQRARMPGRRCRPHRGHPARSPKRQIGHGRTTWDRHPSRGQSSPNA